MGAGDAVGFAAGEHRFLHIILYFHRFLCPLNGEWLTLKQKKNEYLSVSVLGTPEGTRTPDLLVRSKIITFIYRIIYANIGGDIDFVVKIKNILYMFEN